MDGTSERPARSSGLQSPRLFEMIRELAKTSYVGTFIDQSLGYLEDLFKGCIVSFNRIDLAAQTASTCLRPYRAEFDQAAEGVASLLEEHPLFRWYRSQPDWAPVRISDVVPWDLFRHTRLLREVLAPIGACHMIAIMLVPPTTGQFIYFGVSRGDPDFTRDDLALCCTFQPALVALHASLTLGEQINADDTPPLTRRERAVLNLLADGLTADAIARRISSQPATVRKHLQNMYAKLGTSDRLGAVIRGRELGLLRAEDLSRTFQWNIRLELRGFGAGGKEVHQPEV